jgi:hypothetical protein
MTAGQHGLVYANTGGDLVNPEYGGQADNLIIDGGLLITAQVYDPGSYGFAFYGSGGDADCNIISGLGCQNFGVGFLVASASNTKFTACSTFRDGDGVRIPGQLPGIGGGSAIVNNISFESCQLSYCYSNGLHLLSGVVTVQNGDVAVGNLLDGDWNARSVLLEGGNVVFHGVRFEYYGTNSNVAAIGPPNTMSMELDHCFFAATYTTSDTFGVFLSNCPCVFIDTQPSRASDFTQVREFNYGGYGSACVNLGTGPLNLLYHNFANGADVATYVGPFRSDYSGYRTPALNNFYFQDHSSVWNGSGQSYGGDDYTTSLFVGAHLRGFNGSATPYWADLLQYEKERQSFAFLNAGRVTNTWSARDLVASNSISVGWSGQFNGSGAGLTNLPPAAPSAALAGVTTLVQTISNPPTQAQVQAIQNKLNELINALKQP